MRIKLILVFLVFITIGFAISKPAAQQLYLAQRALTLLDAIAATPTDDVVIVGNGLIWQAKAIPDCGESGTLNYAALTNTFSCLTDASVIGGTLTATELQIDFDTCGIGVGKPSYTCKVTVTDAGVSASSKILISQSGNAATSRQADENEMDFLACNALPASGSFTLTCLSLQGPAHSKYKVFYVIGS